MDQDVALSKGKEAKPSGFSTLLPSPLASVVSLVTRGSSLYLRLGTSIGGLALDGARITTLTGLELSRALLEGILSRAGRDVAIRSRGELGRLEAEGVLERSLGTLHSTITNISFAASTGFHFSSAMLHSAGDISQQLLASLDGILGSTDSSRAIASIITLIRREFQNPATGQQGEKVGVADLLIGICGLALLQAWSQKMIDEESKEHNYEEVVWDVVILNDGRRADVAAAQDAALLAPDSMSFITAANEVVQGTEKEDYGMGPSGEDMTEIRLRQMIMKSLPANASVSIKTETTTTKTMTVEITGAPAPDLTPPPGVEIIEENSHHPIEVDQQGGMTNEHGKGLSVPSYRVVYRLEREKLRETNLEANRIIDDEVAVVDDIHTRHRLSNASLASITSSTPSSETETPPRPPRKNSGSSRLNPVSAKREDGLSGQTADSSEHQKRPRRTTSISSSISGSDNTPPRKMITKNPVRSTQPDRVPAVKLPDKKGILRNPLKRGTLTSSSTRNKESESSSSKKEKPPWGIPTGKPPVPSPSRGTSLAATHGLRRGSIDLPSTRHLELPDSRSSSRASYYSIHEQRRDSIVSQTDTYSVHSVNARPVSPTAFRTHLRAQSSVLRARSERQGPPPSPSKDYRRSKLHAPSIYTLQTNDSATDLTHRSHFGSPFDDFSSLVRTGVVDGLFPQHHVVRNITRYIRFASASYGANFLRVMGITTGAVGREINDAHHHEHHSFSTHTQLPPSTILLSSFVDPQGGTDSSGQTNTGVPMVHFVSLDHASKAVVLTCRGTLGFEDVLADMTCDYDDLAYRGKSYKVHKGIHASARRLLEGSGSRVLTTITAALEEFPDYGVVFCGHSLGGGVAALLAVMISEPAEDFSSSAFYTSSPQLLITNSDTGTAPIRLPPGRPIHVYAYGPPATMSASLRLATRGLITSVVHGQDLVPYLSLGVLQDLQAVALAFKTDDSGAKGEVRRRIWEGITGSFTDKWYNRPAGMPNEQDDKWAYAALKTLRVNMLSTKLVPPGEVFIVETTPVLQRDAFVKDGSGLGRPAVRVVVRYVRDVEKRYGEVRFGGSMLLDHSPGRYEAALAALGKGVLG